MRARASCEELVDLPAQQDRSPSAGCQGTRRPETRVTARAALWRKNSAAPGAGTEAATRSASGKMASRPRGPRRAQLLREHARRGLGHHRAEGRFPSHGGAERAPDLLLARRRVREEQHVVARLERAPARRGHVECAVEHALHLHVVRDHDAPEPEPLAQHRLQEERGQRGGGEVAEDVGEGEVAAHDRGDALARRGCGRAAGRAVEQGPEVDPVSPGAFRASPCRRSRGRGNAWPSHRTPAFAHAPRVGRGEQARRAPDPSRRCGGR